MKQGTVAMAAAIVGAVGSVALNFLAGLYKSPAIVIAMFVLWVPAPFVALMVAHVASRGWSVVTRAALHRLMLGLPLIALTAYAFRVLRPPASTLASVFVAVPLLCWLAMLIVLPAAALLARRPSHRGGGT